MSNVTFFVARVFERYNILVSSSYAYIAQTRRRSIAIVWFRRATFYI